MRGTAVWIDAHNGWDIRLIF